MDSGSMEDSWANLPPEIVDKVLSHEWCRKHLRAICRLVCRDWKEAIGRTIQALHTGHQCPFSSRDLHRLSQFPNLRSIFLRGCTSKEPRECIHHLNQQCLEMVNAVQQPTPPKLDKMKQLEHVTIDNPEELELDILLAAFCSSCPLKWLTLKQACLTNESMISMKAATTLTMLSLIAMDMKPGVQFMDSLMDMDQLKSVELSFSSTVWLGSVVMFSHLSKLECLKISPKNFDLRHLSSLSQLTSLYILILDDVVDGDSFNLSRLFQIRHLSIDCYQMPQWIPSMLGLQSLALIMRDDPTNEDRLEALMSITPRLKCLELTAPHVDAILIQDVISNGKSLKKIKLDGHPISRGIIPHLNEMKELNIQARNQDQSIAAMQSIAHLTSMPQLKSLSMTLSHMPDHTFFPFSDPTIKLDALVKLVAQGVSTNGVRVIIQWMHRLEDLRLPEGRYSLEPFETMSPTCLPVLRNLCLSNSSRFGGGFNIDVILRHPIVTRLDHFGFKGYYTPDSNVTTPESLKWKSRVLVDTNMDWEPPKLKSLADQYLF